MTWGHMSSGGTLIPRATSDGSADNVNNRNHNNINNNLSTDKPLNIMSQIHIMVTRVLKLLLL